MPGPDLKKPEEPPTRRRRRPAAATLPPDGSGEGSRTALARMLEQEKIRGNSRPPDDPGADELLGGPKF